MQNGVASKRMHTVLLPENQYFSFRDTLNALQAVNYKDATYVLQGIREDEEQHQVNFYYNFLSFISCCYTNGLWWFNCWNWCTLKIHRIWEFLVKIIWLIPRRKPKEVQSFLLMFYPPKGTEGGPIVFTYGLSPEGNRRRSNCFYLCFIPQRESAKQIPKEVQLFLLMSYFVLGNVYWTRLFFIGNGPQLGPLGPLGPWKIKIYFCFSL